MDYRPEAIDASFGMFELRGADLGVNARGQTYIRGEVPAMRGLGGALLVLDCIPVLYLIIEGARNGWNWDRTMAAMCQAMCVIALAPANPCASRPDRCMA